MEDTFLLAIVFAPALVGLGALFVAVLLFRRAKSSSNPTFLRVVATLALLVALGVGSCYGMMALS